jgi:hypothetical protein
MIPHFHRAVAASRGVAVRRRARYAAGGGGGGFGGLGGGGLGGLGGKMATRKVKRALVVLMSAFSSLIVDHPPAVAPVAPPPSPGPAHYLVARDHRLAALRHVHLLMNVLHRDLLVSARSRALHRGPPLRFRWALAEGAWASYRERA